MMGVTSLRSTKRQPIEKALGIRFGGEELYVWAFTHRSFAYENGGLPTNERLEFLGNAVSAWSRPTSSTAPSPTCPKASWPSHGRPR